MEKKQMRKKAYECKLCGFTTEDKAEIINHMGKEHIDRCFYTAEELSS